MGKASEGTSKTEGEIVLLPNFRRDNSDFRFQGNNSFTLSFTAHNFANSETKNLFSRACFQAIVVKPN